MPLIMDHDLDGLDELFGDTAPLALTPAPPVRGLLQRVDELRINGCCQKVAWSKVGCIAYITQDGRDVHLSHLRCNPKTGQWEHTGDELLDYISNIYRGRELIHLSWNPSGVELAVVDVFGRLCLFSIVVGLNRIGIIRPCIGEPEDSLNAVVGLMWLNVDRTVPLYHPSEKVEGQWKYPLSQHRAMPPYNPSLKPAILTITRSGAVRLVFQTQDTRWHEVKYELDGFSSASDVLTHAALSPDKDSTILLVVHTINNQIRLYRMTIDWNQPFVKQQIPTAYSQPICHFQNLKIIDNCLPSAKLDGIDHVQPDLYLTPASYAQLSHLELLSQGADLQDPGAGPTVLAIFSHIPHHYHSIQLQEEPFSIISRWTLRTEKLGLHSCFGQLVSKKHNPSTSMVSEEFMLRRTSDTRIDRLILGFQQLHLGTVVATTYSDGNTELRDRLSMDVLPFDQEDDRVLGLGQIGFGFFDVEPCIHTTISPNACVKISLSAARKPRIIRMQISQTRLTELLDRGHMERIAIAFVLQSSMACTHNNNGDDLLMVMELFKHQLSLAEQSADLLHWEDFRRIFLNESYRALHVNLDRTIDQPTERMLRDPTYQKCFSLQNSLGYNGEQIPQSLSSKVAWTVLNLRMISITFMVAFRQNTGAESELNKPEVIQAMLGIVPWLLSLMNYIFDELLELNDMLYKHDSPFDLDSIRAKIISLNAPALALVLVSSSRSYLRYTCRGLRGLADIAKNNPHSPLFSPLNPIFASFPVNVSQVEKTLAEIDSGVKKAYQAATHITDRRRHEMERDMLVSGSAIPDVLGPVVERLLTTTMDNLKEEVDAGELYFLDVSWLGLSDDGKSITWKEEHMFDGMRKVEIADRQHGHDTASDTNGSGIEKQKASNKLRRCTRCCTAMLDGLPPKDRTCMWLANMQRTCFCGGFWVME